VSNNGGGSGNGIPRVNNGSNTVNTLGNVHVRLPALLPTLSFLPLGNQLVIRILTEAGQS
jgi:hypothetical protein